MIMIEPNKVDENADRIDALAKQMKAQMDAVWQRVNSLRNDWQDDVQVDFDSKFRKLVNNFTEFSEQIPAYTAAAHEHADAMRRIGKKI